MSDLEENDASVEVVNFRPHYHTLTMSGNSHFLRVADALAEYVDNSIQACMASPEVRKIKLGLYLNLSSPSFLTIMDNGVGMTTEDIKHFATYSFDRNSRGRTEGNQSKSFISKFGVGAKQAGFFLGERIRLLTKIAGESPVKEFMLDSATFEKRSLANEDTFEGSVRRRPVGQPAFTKEFMPDDEILCKDLLADVIAHENSESSFTIMIIKLKHDHTKKLMYREDRMLHSELAEIYHFHIMPQDKVFLTEGRGALSAQETAMGGVVEPDTPLCISYTARINGKIVFEFADLREEGVADPVREFINAGRSSFPFSMDIPDPAPGSNMTYAAQQQMQLTQARMYPIGSADSIETRFKVHGVLYYYPYENGKETMPQQIFDQRSSRGTGMEERYGSQAYGAAAAAAAAGAAMEAGAGPGTQIMRTQNAAWAPSQHSHSHARSRGSDDTDGTNAGVGYVPIDMFNVYWQDRLVPETIVHELPFFPKRIKESSKIPLNWHGRVKGYLFFDWKFRHISNNKLKIQVDPNLDVWLNRDSTEKESLYYPKKTPEAFRGWLEQCHKDFDKEYNFTNRVENPEVGTNHAKRAYFEKLVLGSGTISLNKKDKVKWVSIDARSKKSGFNILAEVVDFEIREKIPADAAVYSGTGYVRYRRLPARIYGEKVHTEVVTAINFSEPSKFKVSKSDLAAVEKQAAESISVFLFNAPHQKSAEDAAAGANDGNAISRMNHMPIDDGFEFAVGFEYWKIGVQLFSPGDPDIPVFQLPDCGKAIANDYEKLYSVRVTKIETMDGLDVEEGGTVYSSQQQEDRSEVIINKPYYYNEMTDNDQEAHAKVPLIDRFYSQYNFSVKHTGTVKLQVDVIRGTGDARNPFQPVCGANGQPLSRLLTCKSISDMPAVCVVELCDLDDQRTIRLDEPLPPFRLQLYDQVGNPVTYVGAIHVKVKCDQMSKVVCVEAFDQDNSIPLPELLYLEEEQKKKEKKSGKSKGNASETLGKINIFPVRAKDRGAVPSFANKDSTRKWCMVPSRKQGCLLSPTELKSFEVFSFNFTVTLLDSSYESTSDKIKNGIVMDVMKPLEVRVGPGLPKTLTLLKPSRSERGSEGELVVKNGEPLPDLQIGCLDKYLNRCGPLSGGKEWTLQFTGRALAHLNTLKKPIKIDPSIGGTAIVSHVVVDIDQILPEGGVTMQHSIQLTCEEDENEIQFCDSLVLDIKVLPAFTPASVQVLRRGQAIESSFTAPVGTCIGDLSFCVIDENGDVIEVDHKASMFKNSFFEVSWLSSGNKKRKARIDSTMSLPDIQLPTVVTGEPIEFELEANIYGSLVSQSFHITLQPGPPAAWTILTPTDDDDNDNGAHHRPRTDKECTPVLIGEPLVLGSSIRGICLVDEFGNIIDIDTMEREDPSSSFPLPQMSVSLSEAYIHHNLETLLQSSAINLEDMRDGNDNYEEGDGGGVVNESDDNNNDNNNDDDEDDEDEEENEASNMQSEQMGANGGAAAASTSTGASSRTVRKRKRNVPAVPALSRQQQQQQETKRRKKGMPLVAAADVAMKQRHVESVRERYRITVPLVKTKVSYIHSADGDVTVVNPSASSSSSLGTRGVDADGGDSSSAAAATAAAAAASNSRRTRGRPRGGDAASAASSELTAAGTAAVAAKEAKTKTGFRKASASILSVACYGFSPEALLENMPLGAEIVFTVSDSSSQATTAAASSSSSSSIEVPADVTSFASCEHYGRVEAGYPRVIHISSVDMNVPEPSDVQYLDVAKFATIDDFHIHILDNCGNACNLERVRQLSVKVGLSETASANDDSGGGIGIINSPVFKKANVKNCPLLAPLKLEFAQHCNISASAAALTAVGDSGEGAMELQAPEGGLVNKNNTDSSCFDYICSASYTLPADGSTVELRPAHLICTVKRFNNINEVTLSFPSTSTAAISTVAAEGGDATEQGEASKAYHVVVPCTAALPSFDIGVITDDGISFYPVAADFSISNISSLNYGRGKSKKSKRGESRGTGTVNVPFSELFELKQTAISSGSRISSHNSSSSSNNPDSGALLLDLPAGMSESTYTPVNQTPLATQLSAHMLQEASSAAVFAAPVGLASTSGTPNTSMLMTTHVRPLIPYRVHLDSNGKIVGGLLAAGQYKLSVTYNESRPEITRFDFPEFVSTSLTFEILPGKATSLVPSADTHQQLQHVVVTNIPQIGNNSGTAASSKCVIGRNLAFYLHDDFQNCCSFEEMHSTSTGNGSGRTGFSGAARTRNVRCKVKPASLLSAPQQSSSSGVAPCPQLKGANKSGYLIGELSEDGKTCSFETVEVDVYLGGTAGHTDCPDGTYILEFSAFAVSSDDPTSGMAGSSLTSSSSNDLLSLNMSEPSSTSPTRLQSKFLQWCPTFEYTSSQKRHQHIQDIRSKLKPITERLQESRRLKGELSAVKAELLQMERDKDMPANIKNFTESGSLDELDALIDRRVQEEKDMCSHMQTLRPVKQPRKHFNPAHFADLKDFIGFPADYAFVDNLDEAKIVSWACRSNMDIAFVSTSESSKFLFSKGIKSLALDQVISYKFNGSARTEEQMREKKLPLILPETMIDVESRNRQKRVPVAGNPQFLINMICLKDENEHLRDSMFWNMLGGALLFDDMTTAMNYRKSLVAEGKRPATLYTRTKERVQSSGILDPTEGQGRIPKDKDLLYIFGQPEPSNQQEINKLQDQIDILKRLRSKLAEKHNLKNEIDSIDATSLKAEQKDLERSLREYGYDESIDATQNPNNNPAAATGAAAAGIGGVL